MPVFGAPRAVDAVAPRGGLRGLSIEDLDAEDWFLDWTGGQGAKMEHGPRVASRGCRGFGREVSTPDAVDLASWC